MSPDDPRHGSTKGFHAGCRELCCRRAIAAYEKRGRLNRHQGIRRAIPAIGAQRRLQALMAIGWTSEDIRIAAGWAHRNHVLRILKGQKGKPTTWIERGTYETVRATYGQMCMRLPEMTPARARCKMIAARKGWVPPLAWDDIDDPNEQPARPGPTSATAAANAERAATLRDFDAWGEGVTQACRRLNISQPTLEKWCRRHGLSDLFSRLVAREDYREPTNTFGGAA